MSKIKTIKEFCITNKLPLTLQHTAIVYYKRVQKKKQFYENDLNISDDRIMNCCLSLAMKSENFNQNFNKMFHVEFGKDEFLVSDLVEYRFHVPCPYLRVAGILVLMWEKGLVKAVDFINDPENRLCVKRVKRNIDSLIDIWNNSVCNIDLLCELDDYLTFSTVDVAVASIELDCDEIGKVVKFDKESVKKLKEGLNKQI